MKVPKYTRAIHQELMSGLSELDEAYGKTAEAANAREWLREFDAFWPTLEGMADGIDRFADYPIAGMNGGDDVR